MTKGETIEFVIRSLEKETRVQVEVFDVEVAKNLNSASVRRPLLDRDIIIEEPKTGNHWTFSKLGVGSVSPLKPVVVKVERKQTARARVGDHDFVSTSRVKDIIDALASPYSPVLWFRGPTGGGKSVTARYVAEQMGRKLYQVNCHGNIPASVFLGHQTVKIDPVTGQNHIVFVPGIVESAMCEGLDDKGNEVGPAGILYIDEAPSMPASVAMALNRVMESDEPRRTLVVSEDGGRVVRSHSQFRIIAAGNTMGRGVTTMAESAYTAQMDALDLSFLSRIGLVFVFGYNREVECRVLSQIVADDRLAAMVLKFRDAIRDQIKAGRLVTPFSTRDVVKLAVACKIYNDIGRAIYYVCLNSVLPQERAVYNEVAIALGLKDLLLTYESGLDEDFV